MYISILGRQPALGMAELEQLYGASATSWFSDISATINHDSFDFERLAGSQKAGAVVTELHGDWHQVSTRIVSAYVQTWSNYDGKITLGISAYGFNVSVRDIQKTGLILKKKLREKGVSLRLIPNNEMSLNTATSHHNKLGLANNKVELLIVRASSGKVIIAESIGSQNITALARRDQGRPKRDAFVGMLPPKLARLMVNLAPITGGRILDPFCGTGVILQEAALVGFDIYGTDLAEKMIDFSRINLDWLKSTHHVSPQISLSVADAMNASWQKPIDAVVCETYLGQPFSAPPSASKLVEVRGNCNHIISQFLKNISAQLDTNTPLCVAIPAWRDANGRYTHLPLVDQLEQLGYARTELVHVRSTQLLYYREDQVVARELLILKKT